MCPDCGEKMKKGKCAKCGYTEENSKGKKDTLKGKGGIAIMLGLGKPSMSEKKANADKIKRMKKAMM